MPVFCGQCGKRVMDNMLFCPFCGAAIVIPDQDEAGKTALAPETKLSETAAGLAPEADGPVSLFGDESARASEKKEAEEEFVPLSFDFDRELERAAEAPVEPVSVEPEPVPESEPEIEDVPEAATPLRRSPERTRRPENTHGRSANTYIPVKDVEPENLFMDDGDFDDDDEYDLDNEEDFVEEDFEFEEPERGSFFQRHVRGIVGLILLAIILLVCVLWFMSYSGQLTLAGWNLAWTPRPYADLAYKAYQGENYAQAAQYYERALSMDGKNYEYAHSAMVAYYDAGNTEAAAAMARKCVEMQPDNPEPYQELLIIYPDADTRPWEITELVRLGYQRTGNEALKLDAGSE